jgi:glyoxylase-like metal-dependent hydrolase (beta-lactamase superfamily II)
MHRVVDHVARERLDRKPFAVAAIAGSVPLIAGHRVEPRCERSGGSRVLHCGYAPRAHTDVDVYVHLPEDDLLFAGDLLAVGVYPIADYVTGGWIDGLIAANESLLQLCDDATRIVPGTGPVQGKAQLLAQLEMCRSVREKTVALMKQGLSLKEIMAAVPTHEFDAQWGDPTLFLYLIYHGVIDHIRETGGIG